MLRLKRILLAYDLSAVAKWAATTAFHLAERHKAEVHMLTVSTAQHDLVGPGQRPVVDLGNLEEQLQQESRDLIETADLDAEGTTVYCKALRDVSAAPAIVEYASKHDIDLIVAGTHGRRGIHRALLGSVAAELLRTAPCPVMTGNPSLRRAPQPVRRMLVPVDFSELSKAALRYAARLARLFDARLHVLHVIEDLESEEIPGFKPLALEESERYKRMHQRLERWAKDIRAKKAEHVVIGRPADEIISFASQKDIDLIVMPTRGQTGLQHVLLGSVAEKIITDAPCPVISAKDFAPHLVQEETVVQD